LKLLVQKLWSSASESAFFHWASSFKKTKKKKCEWWARCVEVSLRAKWWGLVLKQFKHRKSFPHAAFLNSWHQLVPYRIDHLIKRIHLAEEQERGFSI